MSIFQASYKAALNLDERGGGTGGDSQLSGGKEEPGETEQKQKMAEEVHRFGGELVFYRAN